MMRFLYLNLKEIVGLLVLLSAIYPQPSVVNIPSIIMICVTLVFPSVKLIMVQLVWMQVSSLLYVTFVKFYIL